MENYKKGNSTLAYALCVVIGFLIAVLLFKSCDKPMPQLITKGTFVPSKVKPSNVNPIPEVVYIKGKTITKTDSSEVKKFKTLYNLSQKEYDSLLIYNNSLAEIVKTLKDTNQQKKINDCKFIEFSHVFDNDTLKATVSGITRGSPERLKLDYEYKLPKQKETVFRLSAGGLFAASKTLSNPTATSIISGQFKSGSQVIFGYDTNSNIVIGGTVSVFAVKR